MVVFLIYMHICVCGRYDENSKVEENNHKSMDRKKGRAKEIV